MVSINNSAFSNDLSAELSISGVEFLCQKFTEMFAISCLEPVLLLRFDSMICTDLAILILQLILMFSV